MQLSVYFHSIFMTVKKQYTNAIPFLSGLGGEQISLAIQSLSSESFRAAGYASISTNDSYIGGVVRQHGNLSFSRVFDAGHQGMLRSLFSLPPPHQVYCIGSCIFFLLVPYYQPETAYRIFSRAMAGSDIATGQILTEADYSTAGPSSSFCIKNTVPQPPKPLCYTWDVMETCTPPQAALLANGTAIVRDFIMVGYVLPDGTEVIY